MYRIALRTHSSVLIHTETGAVQVLPPAADVLKWYVVCYIVSITFLLLSCVFVLMDFA